MAKILKLCKAEIQQARELEPTLGHRGAKKSRFFMDFFLF